MNIKQAYKIGRDKGYDIGYDLLVEARSKGDIETMDQLVTIGCDCEMNSRQFSPFEFTAKEFNDSQVPESTWDEYERGVRVGLRKAWREFS